MTTGELARQCIELCDEPIRTRNRAYVTRKIAYTPVRRKRTLKLGPFKPTIGQILAADEASQTRPQSECVVAG